MKVLNIIDPAIIHVSILGYKLTNKSPLYSPDPTQRQLVLRTTRTKWKQRTTTDPQ